MSLAAQHRPPLVRHTLDNGLTLLIREARHNPVVTVDAWVNTGARNEPAPLNGVSHFLEHMLFKGTDRRGPNEIDTLVESVGGSWNAGTSKDYTHYYCTVAAPFRETAVDVVCDIIRRATIDPAEMEKERLVILEEWRRKNDDPGGVLYDAMYPAAFIEGPYRDTVLGSFETISSIPRDGMVDYFERYYAPRNMALLIAGDIAAEEAIALVERHMGDWEREYRPFDAPTPPARRRRGHRTVIEKEVAETYYAMMFPAPGIDRLDDIVALDLLETVMGDGLSSRLQQRLVERDRLAHNVWAGYPAHLHEGLFYVTADLDGEQLEAARAAIIEEVERLQQAGPTEREMARAKTKIRNDTTFATEKTTGQTSHTGFLFTLTGDVEFEETYLERVEATSAAQVAEVARQWLEPSAANEVVLRPAGDGAAADDGDDDPDGEAGE
jgi:zinc protease